MKQILFNPCYYCLNNETSNEIFMKQVRYFCFMAKIINETNDFN